jgi:hypothetical protein
MVAEYLREDLRPRAPKEDAFLIAVAANACRIVGRELEANYEPSQLDARHHADELSAALRAGSHDADFDVLVDQLRAQTLAKLMVAHPDWL